MIAGVRLQTSWSFSKVVTSPPEQKRLTVNSQVGGWKRCRASPTVPHDAVADQGFGFTKMVGCGAVRIFPRWENTRGWGDRCRIRRRDRRRAVPGKV